MRTRKTLTSITAGVVLATSSWVLAGCTSEPSGSAVQSVEGYSVPQIDPPVEGAHTFAQTLFVSRLKVANREICPVIEFNGGEALFVLPTGAVGAAEPPTVTFSGITFSRGDRLTVGALNVIPGGFACGEEHWDLAVRLHGTDPTIALQSH